MRCLNLLLASSSTFVAAIVNTFHMKLLTELTHGLLPKIIVSCVRHQVLCKIEVLIYTNTKH